MRDAATAHRPGAAAVRLQDPAALLRRCGPTHASALAESLRSGPQRDQPSGAPARGPRPARTRRGSGRRARQVPRGDPAGDREDGGGARWRHRACCTADWPPGPKPTWTQFALLLKRLNSPNGAGSPTRPISRSGRQQCRAPPALRPGAAPPGSWCAPAGCRTVTSPWWAARRPARSPGRGPCCRRCRGTANCRRGRTARTGSARRFSGMPGPSSVTVTTALSPVDAERHTSTRVPGGGVHPGVGEQVREDLVQARAVAGGRARARRAARGPRRGPGRRRGRR